ncbi:MAG: phage tail tape measure protein [Paracoccus sp. (in: a-proteobacteria)]|uniref:phage tail tape measure protein n=1 Tax=Paracoccus sp. TaxID=267 RepID=UPI0026DF94C3|nr:phage tail tape measure protein [Paracoccus sp. (in: a-proteobacteria)]MDO5631148.1 phage tail tape measure protein [Paracoccus sp. (in: a-proteobacteria)]
MTEMSVALVMRLIDQLSAPLKKVTDALTGVKTGADDVGDAMDGAGSSAGAAGRSVGQAFGPQLPRQIDAVKGAADRAGTSLDDVAADAKEAGAALDQAFGPQLPRKIDQITTSADRAQGAFGRLRRAAGDFGEGLGAQLRTGFSTEKIDEALKENEKAVAAARGRMMGAFGMAASLAAPLWLAGNYQADLIDYGNLAGLSLDQRNDLSRQLDGMARADTTGMGSGELLAGLGTYVGKGMTQESALGALVATARAAKATRSEFTDMANAGFAVMDNFKVAPADLDRAFNIMAASGKEGSFELKDMARKFAELTASAQALGLEGTNGVASLSAALQIAMKAAGGADQAANNTANFFGKLTAPDTVKKFEKFGVDLEKELRGATERGADPLEHMLGVIEQITGGDQFKMGELFADKQVLDFLRAVIPNLEEYRRIKEASASAEGVIDSDYQAVMDGFNESVSQLGKSLRGLFSASGALLPALTELVQGATSMVDVVRDWTAANPELTAWLVKGAAMMLGMGIATRVLGFAFAVGRGHLIRFLSLFLKFNDAGKNISIVARLLRGLGAGIRALPALRWASLIAPLRWAAFLPQLAWSSVIGVLRWGAFIPRRLFLRDFGPGVTQIGPAMLQAAAQTEVASRRMQVAMRGIMMRAGLAAASMAWLARSMPSDPADMPAFQRANNEQINNTFRSIPGLSQLMAGYDWAFEKVHGYRPESYPGAGNGTAPPAPRPTGGLNDRAVSAAAHSGTTPWMRGAPPSALIPIQFQPPAGAGGLGAAQPTRPEPVKVEETINHDYSVQHDVTVTVPVQITQEVKADAVALARDIGQRTERAVRKALSDQFVPQ